MGCLIALGAGSSAPLRQLVFDGRVSEMPSMLALRVTVVLASIAMMMVGAGYAVRHPTCGLQDRVAGTRIVPGPPGKGQGRLNPIRSRPVSLFRAPFEDW